MAGSLLRSDNSRLGTATSTGPDASGRLTFTLLYEIGIEDNPYRWRFILRATDGHDELVAEDVEPGVHGERLELLTVLRALESLNQASRIIIWTRSPALKEGLLYGLREWPAHDWCWERFGERVPVRNRDLWQRMERAAQFHEIECRTWRFDPPHVHDVNPPNSPGLLNGLLAATTSRKNPSDVFGVRRRGGSWRWLLRAFLAHRSRVDERSP